MLRVAVVLLLALLAAPTAVKADCLSNAELSAKLTALQSALGAAEYGSLPGQFSFFNISSCELTGQSCNFQNPTSPYGFVQLPNNPAQPPLPGSLPQLVVNGSWRLLASDAVIIVGCTPPASQYFAFTPYVTMHYTAATNTWTNIFGSMGDSVNQASVQTFGNDGSVGSSPWGYNAVYVLTGSTTVFSMVSPVIIQTFGLMNSFQVNYMYLPFGPTAPSWPGLQYGLNFYDDSFTVLFRQAIAADPIAFAVWENSQPFRVLRAFYTGGYPLNLASVPNLHLKQRYSPPVPANTEYAVYGSQFSALVNQTISNLAGRYNVVQVPNVPNVLGYQLANWGGVCYLANVQCAGDNRDATYQVNNITNWFSDPTDTYIVIGSNSKYTGFATAYSNIVVNNYVEGIGLDDVTNLDYAGSANVPVPNFSKPYLSPTPTPLPALFKWTFARTCAPLDTACTEVASSGWPSLPESAIGLLITRSYFASANFAAPYLANPTTNVPVLIPTALLAVQDKCKPQACDATSTCRCWGVLEPGKFIYDIAFGSLAVSQSSTHKDFVAQNAVDGLSHTYSKTNFEFFPYWDIDLGFVKQAKVVTIAVPIGHWPIFEVFTSTHPFPTSLFGSDGFESAKSMALEKFEVNLDGKNAYFSFVPFKSFQYLRIQKLGWAELALSEVYVEAYCQN